MVILSKEEHSPWLVTNEKIYTVVLCHVFSLSLLWSIDFHLCFGWRNASWMRVGVQEFWPLLRNQVCPVDVQFRGKNACVTWQRGIFGNLICPLDCYCSNSFSAALSVLLRLSSIAILHADWFLILLVTIIATLYGLVTTLNVTGHATTARWR